MTISTSSRRRGRRPLRPRELRALQRRGYSDPVIVLSLAVVFIFSVVSLHLLSKGASTNPHTFFLSPRGWRGRG